MKTIIDVVSLHSLHYTHAHWEPRIMYETKIDLFILFTMYLVKKVNLNLSWWSSLQSLCVLQPKIIIKTNTNLFILFTKLHSL